MAQPFEHNVRVFPPDAEEGDVGPMFVFEALGVSIIVRERQAEDGAIPFLHIESMTGKPLDVEVNNGGENRYGGG